MKSFARVELIPLVAAKARTDDILLRISYRPYIRCYTVMSSGSGGTAAAMAQNEQTAEEHSTLTPSSSHQEGSITKRGASCGRENNQRLVRTIRGASTVSGQDGLKFLEKIRTKHRLFFSLPTVQDLITWVGKDPAIT